MPWSAMGLVRHATSFFMHSRHTHREELKKFLELTARTTRTGYRNRLTILKSYDVREQLREIQCPVLFLAAENDHLIPSVAQARLMTKKLASASLRVLDGHGHICLIAPGVDMCSIIAEWQSSISRGANG